MKTETEIVQEVFRLYLEHMDLTPNTPDLDNPTIDTNAKRESVGNHDSSTYRLKQLRKVLRLAVDVKDVGLWDFVLQSITIKLPTLHSEEEWKCVNYFELVRSEPTAFLKPVLDELFHPSSSASPSVIEFWTRIRKEYGSSQLYLFRMALFLQTNNPRTDLMEFKEQIDLALGTLPKLENKVESTTERIVKIVGGTTKSSFAPNVHVDAWNSSSYAPSVVDEF